MATTVVKEVNVTVQGYRDAMAAENPSEEEAGAGPVVSDPEVREGIAELKRQLGVVRAEMKELTSVLDSHGLILQQMSRQLVQVQSMRPSPQMLTYGGMAHGGMGTNVMGPSGMGMGSGGMGSGMGGGMGPGGMTQSPMMFTPQRQYGDK